MTSLVVVLAYLCFMIALNLFCARKSKSNTEFFRGTGRTPWYVVAIAMISTSISGVSFVSVPGMVEASQWSYLQMVLGFVAGYVVIAFVLLPLYYSLRLNSLYEYLDQRFGKSSYKSGAALFLISKVLGCGIRLYLTAMVLQIVLFETLGVPFWLNVLITMTIVWAYTVRGGVASIVWTDMIQTLVLLSTVALTIIAISNSLGLDFNSLVSAISDSGMSKTWFFDDFKDTRYFWKQFMAGMFTTIAMTGLDQDMMQKNLSCRSLRDSQKNMLSYGVGFLPVNLLFLSLGVVLYLFANSKGISVDKPDELFAQVSCFGYLPSVVSVLFVLGLVSASFSSAGSALTALTSSLTLDILRPVNNELIAVRKRKITHTLIALFMAIVVCVFQVIGSESVINVVYKMVGYTYGPLLGMFCFGMLTHKTIRDSWTPIICVISPLLCLVLSLNSEAWLGGYKIGFELLIINAIFTMLGLWLSSILVKRDRLKS